MVRTVMHGRLNELSVVHEPATGLVPAGVEHLASRPSAKNGVQEQ
jgi:hypothetical protein